METPIYEVNAFYKAIVINRPSKKIKSPYLADIKIFDENDNIVENEELAHSPALGCCGLIQKDTIVYVVLDNDEKSKRKSKYTIFNIQIENPPIIIGVHPNSANTMFENILKLNLLDDFNDLKSYKREKTVLNSRIDFFIEKEDLNIYAEIKNVPLADYVDVPKKDRKKYDNDSYNEYEKIAIFPDGYRKNMNDPVSPRALKHICDLMELQKNENTQSYLIYMIQRSDVKYFKPTILDKIYHDKFYEAMESGVKVIPISVLWKNNKAYFNGIIEIV